MPGLFRIEHPSVLLFCFCSFYVATTVDQAAATFTAQVAVSGHSRITHGLPSRGESGFTIHKQQEHYAKRHDDKDEISVTGVMILQGYIIVVDGNFNKKLKLFTDGGKFLSSTDSKMKTWGISRISDLQFATCGENKLMTWTLHRNTYRIRYDETFYVASHNVDGVSYDGTYFCLLNRDGSAITILSNEGRKLRTNVIRDVFGRNIDKLGSDIHSDCVTHNIYLPCWSPVGVLCLSVRGDMLWFADLSDMPLGITEIHGRLCVVLPNEVCVIFLTKNGEKQTNLIGAKDLDNRNQVFIAAFGNKIAITYLRDPLVSLFLVNKT